MTSHSSTTEQELEQLLSAADQAATALRTMPRRERAALLGAVAEALDAAVDSLVPIAQRETHLPEARLRGELQRTTFQLRLFAETVLSGRYLDARIDHADPAWPMGAPRPDLRRTHIPLGPVAVFAASNFPFAFSVAGGDTASALAAGCPVVLKAHSGHPELSVATARVVTTALRTAGAPEGTFALVFGTEVGRTLVQDSRVKAAGFTGSIAGGRALFDLAAARPEPIPFFGELGSTNPVFVTKAADSVRGSDIAEEFVASFTLGSGQFCTKPGVMFVPAGGKVIAALRAATLPAAAAMLNERIRDGYLASVSELRDQGATVLLDGESGESGERGHEDLVAPSLHAVSAAAVLNNPDALLAECFGPTSLVVEYGDEAQLNEFAALLEGQLSATLHAEDDCAVTELIDTLMVKAGRVLWNQWPTGVSVSYAQQHGGPYPASTASGSTSVGTAAIARFVRPVALQGLPQHLLPVELRDDSPLQVPQLVDGQA